MNGWMGRWMRDGSVGGWVGKRWMWVDRCVTG